MRVRSPRRLGFSPGYDRVELRVPREESLDIGRMCTARERARIRDVQVGAVAYTECLN